MLALHPEHLDHLSRGGTLVVPSPQRAAALRVAYSIAQLSAGRCVWPSPDILPWNAWLGRGLDEARARGVPVPRRLSVAEEWWLWRDSVRRACEEVPVLSPEALAGSVRRSTLLLEDYGLELRDAATVEATVLLRARSDFQQRCAAARSLWSASWKACAPFLKPARATRLAGFAELGPARRSWLERNGITVESIAAPSIGFGHRHRDLFAPDEALVEVSGFDSPELEAEAAADWCARCLDRDPRSHLLLVVPRLPEQRHRWMRALAHRLDYTRILGCDAPADSPFVLEGGQPLTAYPMINVAMLLLSLAAGDADFDALSTVLRSSFLDPRTLAARLQIDVWLRQHTVDATHSAALRALSEPIRRRLGEPAGTAWRGLVETLAVTARAAPSGALPVAAWARSFADLLAHAGWPASTLDSHEQQVRVRFEELLGEFATLSAVPHALSCTQASRLLQQLASGVDFEPASDDVAVTVTASLDDPIVRYDGIWVAGLSAEAWPQAMRSDPLIPGPLQRRASMPMVDARDPLRQAEQALQRWQRAAAQVRLSWPRNDGEAPRDPSPLLREFGSVTTASTADAGFRLESWIAANRPPLELFYDPDVPLRPVPAVLSGGTRLLELQANCPFRAFAELRLAAGPLEAPQPGIDPRLRGQILHAALERLWRALGDSQTLQAMSPDATAELINQCVDAALEDIRDRWPSLPDTDELRREAVRDARLLEKLVDWERTRAPFQTLRLEWCEPLRLAGASLQLRLDRVDRLADGSLIVIDYKSGAPKSFEAESKRPAVPQLLAYTIAAGHETVAAVALHLSKEGLKLRGIADTKNRLEDIKALDAGAPGWALLQQRWRKQLEQLIGEFLSGHAAVQPQPKACQLCHLQAFCRVPQPADT